MIFYITGGAEQYDTQREDKRENNDLQECSHCFSFFPTSICCLRVHVEASVLNQLGKYDMIRIIKTATLISIEAH